MTPFTPDSVPKRPRSRFSKFLAYAYVPTIGLGILSIVWLLLQGSAQVSQLKQGVADLKKTQLAQCLSTNDQRKESNAHLRQPLKRAFILASGGTEANRIQHLAAITAEETRLKQLAVSEKDPATKYLLLLVASAIQGNPKLLQAYTVLGQEVTQLKLLNCYPKTP